MSYFQAIILGVFQGIAEFLPISSSAHLLFLQKFLGIEEGNLFFSEILKVGTLISILIVYLNDIIKMIVEFFKLIYNIVKGNKIESLNIYQKLALFIIVGSIPTLIFGLIFSNLFISIIPIGFGFMLTGFLLWFGEKRSIGNKNIKKMTFFDSLIIGLAQGLTIIPGFSRSGATIITSRLRGLNIPLTVEYSFLIAIPLTFVTGLQGIIKFLKSDPEVLINLPLLMGVIIAGITGILAIKILIKALKENKLYYFSYYLWTIGIISIVSQLL